MRKVRCIYCKKEISEGDKAVRHKLYAGFYCSFRCVCLGLGIAKVKTVTNELVEDDKQVGLDGWYEQE